MSHIYDDEKMLKSLTYQEVKVLQMIADGYSSQEIATNNNFSIKRYQQIMTSTYQKLFVTNKTASVVKAIKLGAISI